MEIENRKVFHDYFIEDKLECGISLRGNEIKSIRAGKANIKEAWVQIQDGQLVIRGMHISKYETANAFDVDEDRERILLAHKKEIKKLAEKVKLDGLTLVPIKVYINERGKCKVLVAVVRGKKNYDKRNTIKKRDAEREIARSFKTNNR